MQAEERRGSRWVAAAQAGLFNDSSTHAERQEVLQRLMAQGPNVLGSGVHSPVEVNRMLARSDAEFDLFQQVGTLDWRSQGCPQGQSSILSQIIYQPAQQQHD